jgi:hypothetical protein
VLRAEHDRRDVSGLATLRTAAPCQSRSDTNSAKHKPAGRAVIHEPQAFFAYLITLPPFVSGSVGQWRLLCARVRPFGCQAAVTADSLKSHPADPQ